MQIQGTHMPKRLMCASCLALELRRGRNHLVSTGSVTVSSESVFGNCLELAKKLLQLIGYAAAGILITYLGWLCYEEVLDCIWSAVQGIFYLGLAFFISGTVLLIICKDGEFTINSDLLE